MGLYLNQEQQHCCPAGANVHQQTGEHQQESPLPKLVDKAEAY